MDALDLTDPGTLLGLLHRHGFHARKGLGQHFLVSSRALRAILAVCDGDTPILEIGPGPGTVTRPLAETGRQITTVEIDKEAITLLNETVGAFPNVRIVQGDILKLDLTTLLTPDTQHLSPDSSSAIHPSSFILHPSRWTVVGNLPYYITTPVINHLLTCADRFDRMVFLVQREVADRLAAAPGSPEYGSLSVHVQALAEVKRVATVPPTAFMPPPTVQSAVVCLTIRETPLVPPELRDTFTAVVRAAFGQRRKKLENALAGGGVLNGDRTAVTEAIVAANVDPTTRGEKLGVPEFLRIAQAVFAKDSGTAGVSPAESAIPAVTIVPGEAGCRLAVEQHAIAIVVDALRASATLAALFDRGVTEVWVVATVEDARALKLQMPDALLIGERGGERLPGFDLGNSPCEVLAYPDLTDRTIIFTSSNGAQRLAACAGAAATLVGTVTNTQALLAEAQHLSHELSAPIVFIPAGQWPDEDFVSPEDEATCTYLVQHLVGNPAAPDSCAALPAIFTASPHAQHLIRIGYNDDVTLCTELDSMKSVPKVAGPALLDDKVVGVRLIAD